MAAPPAGSTPSTASGIQLPEHHFRVYLESTTPPRMKASKTRQKQTTCDLEIDVVATNIINRWSLKTTPLNEVGVPAILGGEGRGDSDLLTKARTAVLTPQTLMQDVELYCICKQPYDQNKFYIGCDGCSGWFHGGCVDVVEAKANLIVQFFCPECKSKSEDKEVKGKTEMKGGVKKHRNKSALKHVKEGKKQAKVKEEGGHKSCRKKSAPRKRSGVAVRPKSHGLQNGLNTKQRNKLKEVFKVKTELHNYELLALVLMADTKNVARWFKRQREKKRCLLRPFPLSLIKCTGRIIGTGSAPSPATATSTTSATTPTTTSTATTTDDDELMPVG